jgi:hypothetical protein
MLQLAAGVVQRSTPEVQVYDALQVSPPAHEGVHLPFAQTLPLSHCVWSKHWSAGAVQTPLTHA